MGASADISAAKTALRQIVWRHALEEIELAHLIVDKLEEHQATEIVMLAVPTVLQVLASGEAQRVVRARTTPVLSGNAFQVKEECHYNPIKMNLLRRS